VGTGRLPALADGVLKVPRSRELVVALVLGQPTTHPVGDDGVSQVLRMLQGKVDGFNRLQSTAIL
jgi:hypothetical protein